MLSEATTEASVVMGSAVFIIIVVVVISVVVKVQYLADKCRIKFKPVHIDCQDMLIGVCDFVELGWL